MENVRQLIQWDCWFFWFDVVDVESGNIVIYKTSDDSVVETIDVTSNQVTGSGTSQITINPTNDFESLTEYYLKIDATTFDRIR